MTLNTRHNPIPVQEPYSGIYAHGVEVRSNARQLFVSGQVGIDSSGNTPSDFVEQCRNAIANVKKVLASADMSMSDIVKMQFLLVNPDDMTKLVEIRKELLEGVAPAVTTHFVAGLVEKDWLVEIEAVASKQDGYQDNFYSRLI